jgi:hypothetical protein
VEGYLWGIGMGCFVGCRFNVGDHDYDISRPAHLFESRHLSCWSANMLGVLCFCPKQLSSGKFVWESICSMRGQIHGRETVSLEECLLTRVAQFAVWHLSITRGTYEGSDGMAIMAFTEAVSLYHGHNP